MGNNKKSSIGSSKNIRELSSLTSLVRVSGCLLTVDFEKTFDSLNHKFLIAVLKKYGFGEDFIDWIKILLRDQESCVINGGLTTTYFRLEHGARQGDPISAYLFVLALELFFILLKSNKNIHGINIFNIPGLRPNFSKCELTGIGSLKDAKMHIYLIIKSFRMI